MNTFDPAAFTAKAAELVAANDAAPVASVRLTEAERESLRSTVETYGCCHPIGGPVEADGRCSNCLTIAAPVWVRVEQILADRLAPPIPSQRGPSDEKVES